MDAGRALDDLQLRWFARSNRYRRPIMVLALRGLFDAGKASTNAAVWIRDHNDAELIAEFDPEELYNFSQVRPLTAFDGAGDRIIEWPTIEIYGCRTEGARDLMVVVGTEPHFRWGGVADAIVQIVRHSATSLVVTLGSTLAMTPHTRPARVIGSSGDPILAERMQLRPPTYEGPTGVIGVLHEALERRFIPVLSLRAEVPHYVPGAPNPKATQALLRRLQQLSKIQLLYEQLDGEVHDWVRQVDAAVAADEESRVYLAQLEERVDHDEDRLPSGDDVAGELEAYLRELGSGEQDPPD